MQWLAAICVKRPVFASVLILTLTVIGAFAFSRLGVDRFPKVDFPTILITTRQPGAAPQEIETEITDKIEEAVNTISGIDELRSTSSEGVSIVIVSFVLDKNVDTAAQEVRDKINRAIPLLPGVYGAVREGVIPLLGEDNLRTYQERVKFQESQGHPERLLLCDPQTNGGLLFAVRPEARAQVRAILAEDGIDARTIGEVAPRHASDYLVEVMD